jgi:hypothetical protein
MGNDNVSEERKVWPVFFYDGKYLSFYCDEVLYLLTEPKPNRVCICDKPFPRRTPRKCKCKWKIEVYIPLMSYSKERAILPSLFGSKSCFIYGDSDWPMKFTVYVCDNFFDCPLSFECPLQNLILDSINLSQKIPKMARIKWEIEKALQSSLSNDVINLTKTYVNIVEIEIDGKVFDCGFLTDGSRCTIKITKL